MVDVFPACDTVDFGALFKTDRGRREIFGVTVTSLLFESFGTEGGWARLFREWIRNR